jgi:hypothetical protein
MNELFSSYPKKIKASTQHADRYYVLQEGLYAVHGEIPTECKAHVVNSIEEGKVVICKGYPDELPASVDRNTLTPVYALGANGPLAVPTGLILIRYTDNTVAVSRKQEIKSIGYIIDQQPAYAPQALWLKAANSDIAWALNNASQLEAHTDVVNVEPQMLMQPVRRDSSAIPSIKRSRL